MNEPVNRPTQSTPTEPAPESYMPDYVILMASFLAPGLFPTHGSVLPGSAWVPYAELPDLYDPLGIADNEAIPKALRNFYYDYSPFLAGAAGGPGAGLAGYLVRLRTMIESISRSYAEEGAGATRRLHDSIERLTLANHAIFTFLADEWGITEDDVTERIEEIFADEVSKFLAGAVEAAPQPS